MLRPWSLPDGVVVTTDGTVRQEEDITVLVPDGKHIPATFAGRDRGTDLAVLRIPPGSLSVAELEVLRLVARGLSNKEIAADLRITTHTVKYHLAAVLEKLGVRSRTEAVSLGVRTGLVPL